MLTPAIRATGVSPKAARPLNSLTKTRPTKNRSKLGLGGFENALKTRKCPENLSRGRGLYEWTPSRQCLPGIYRRRGLPSPAFSPFCVAAKGKKATLLSPSGRNGVQNLGNLGGHGLDRGHAVQSLQFALPAIKIDQGGGI